MRPCFGHIEHVYWCGGEVRGVDGLDVDGPGGKIAAVDGGLEVGDVGVWFGGGEGGGFGVGVVVDALVGEQVDAEKAVGAVGFGEGVGVAAVGVEVADGGWEAAVAEEEHEGVDAFLVGGVEVPECVCAWNVGFGVFFVAAVHRGEFDGVADEEDWLEWLSACPMVRG